MSKFRSSDDATQRNSQTTSPPKRILVVDYEPPVAETIRFVLTSSGHAVEVAGDAQQALGLYRAGRIGTMVITDFPSREWTASISPANSSGFARPNHYNDHRLRAK